MLLPLLASVLASLKIDDGGGRGAADLLPARAQPRQLRAGSGTIQAGLPTYLANSAGTALLTILFCLALTIPAGYALARFPIPGKEAALRPPAARR